LDPLCKGLRSSTLKTAAGDEHLAEFRAPVSRQHVDMPATANQGVKRRSPGAPTRIAPSQRKRANRLSRAEAVNKHRSLTQPNPRQSTTYGADRHSDPAPPHSTRPLSIRGSAIAPKTSSRAWSGSARPQAIPRRSASTKALSSSAEISISGRMRGASRWTSRGQANRPTTPSSKRSTGACGRNV